MTNTAVVGGNVTGNIGSCEVKNTLISTDSWHNQSVAVNSCSGEVIYKSDIYFDYGVIYFPSMVMVVIVGIICTLRFIFD